MDGAWRPWVQGSPQPGLPGLRDDSGTFSLSLPGSAVPVTIGMISCGEFQTNSLSLAHIRPGPPLFQEAAKSIDPLRVTCFRSQVAAFDSGSATTRRA